MRYLEKWDFIASVVDRKNSVCLALEGEGNGEFFSKRMDNHFEKMKNWAGGVAQAVESVLQAQSSEFKSLSHQEKKNRRWKISGEWMVVMLHTIWI
jgi:hypothetical protein